MHVCIGDGGTFVQFNRQFFSLFSFRMTGIYFLYNNESLINHFKYFSFLAVGGLRMNYSIECVSLGKN